MFEPRPDSTEATSPSKSLIKSLLCLTVFVGSQAAGEGVINGFSGAIAANGPNGGKARTNGRQRRREMGRARSMVEAG